jgi:predicted ATPase
MLVQFRVENHRSLRDEQVLSLAASSRGDRGEDRLIVLPKLDLTLVPAVAIYGANGSGKTSVLHALAFMCDAVRRSHRSWEPGGGTPRESFILSAKALAPSRYEAEMVVGGTRYRYGFLLGERRVEEEWLFAWPHGRKQSWFTRDGDRFEFGKHMGGENTAIQALTRDNSLFLSAAAQNNHPKLLPIFGWFHTVRFELRRSATAGLDPWHAAMLEELLSDSPERALSAEEDATRRRLREGVLRLIRGADLGILDLRLRPREHATRRAGSIDLVFKHRTADGRGAWLPLEAESAGTVSLVGIAARIVGALGRGGVLCVDEFDASLHPMLVLELLRLMHDREHNPLGAQLVFTTHDAGLLGTIHGDAPLRRDQIWFTEKDEAGATHLYPLLDYSPRKSENMERGYLQGKYGAIPFLGELLLPSEPFSVE